MKISRWVVVCYIGFIGGVGEVKAYVDSPAMVSIDHKGDFRIVNKVDSFDHRYFQAEVSEPEKCSDGSLKLKLKLRFERFKEVVKFNNLEVSNTGTIYIVIPKEELSNKIFYKTIKLETDNSSFELEPIRIKIDPKVEISTDRKKISFGRVYYDGRRLVSSESPTVVISYAVLKDAICEVRSENNFRLKNKGYYIPYTVNGISRNSDIELPSDNVEYIATFQISAWGTKPIAGTYTDKITFTIKTDL